MHNIKTIIETGTWDGDTTEALADLVPVVVTIDVEAPRQGDAKRRLESLGYSNVRFITADSAEGLRLLLSVWPDDPCLMFLDAHGHEGKSPLLRELDVIASFGVRPVIAIHDFHNPEHPEYGFDTQWDLGPYKWSMIEKHIERIYGQRYTVHYNDTATGERRGIVYIEPIGSA